jgi:hypothetical protein
MRERSLAAAALRRVALALAGAVCLALAASHATRARARRYLGAIARYPEASIFVGLTELPPPVTYMEHALFANGICFFYSISTRTPSPPWGVSANLCVRSRTSNEVWFTDCYPRTGGGEDVLLPAPQAPPRGFHPLRAQRARDAPVLGASAHAGEWLGAQ